MTKPNILRNFSSVKSSRFDPVSGVVHLEGPSDDSSDTTIGVDVAQRGPLNKFVMCRFYKIGKVHALTCFVFGHVRCYCSAVLLCICIFLRLSGMKSCSLLRFEFFGTTLSKQQISIILGLLKYAKL